MPLQCEMKMERSWAAPLKIEMRLGDLLHLSVYHWNVCGNAILFTCFLPHSAQAL